MQNMPNAVGRLVHTQVMYGARAIAFVCVESCRLSFSFNECRGRARGLSHGRFDAKLQSKPQRSLLRHSSSRVRVDDRGDILPSLIQIKAPDKGTSSVNLEVCFKEPPCPLNH
jgi:hypothetical protein